uniref:Uncharacterized protein n=1 Tax=Strongyloides papillosus TaxID=174720 RepID=A0A0N5BUP3_STREA
MLTEEIKNNETKIKSQSESINLFKSKIFEISSDLLKYKEENEQLRKFNEEIKGENEKLRIALQNSNQTVNKAQEIIQELRGQATENEIEIGILNSQIKKSDQSQPSAGKDIKIFTRDLKMFIFSMLENCHNYNDINNMVKKSINHFLNREIDDDMSQKLLCKWKEEFEVCSVYVSGYMLEEFIRKKGKGVLIQRKITLKNKKLQTFVLCGNAEGRFYEILLGAIEVKNNSAEYMVKCFEELLETLANVTNNLKEDFILDIYNAIYGYMNDNTRSGKKIYNLFNEKVYFGKDPNDIRKYITYSSISYIGINILKTIEKLVYNLTEGKKIFVFLRNISKELCQENCNYYPSAVAFNNFIKNKLIREKNEGKKAIKPESKISSIEGSSTQMYGIICQDIIYSYSDLIEFSKINENRILFLNMEH